MATTRKTKVTRPGKLCETGDIFRFPLTGVREDLKGQMATVTDETARPFSVVVETPSGRYTASNLKVACWVADFKAGRKPC